MTKKGFTLVELMVVVGILSIIMLVISQPVASIIKYQRESQTTDNLRDNLQFVINKMEKELKTSSNVKLENNNNELTFKDQNDENIKYYLKDSEIKKNTDDNKLTDISILTVTGLNFSINDTTKLVTISISAKSRDDKDSVDMQFSVLPLNKFCKRVPFVTRTSRSFEYNPSHYNISGSTFWSDFMKNNAITFTAPSPNIDPNNAVDKASTTFFAPADGIYTVTAAADNTDEDITSGNGDQTSLKIDDNVIEVGTFKDAKENEIYIKGQKYVSIEITIGNDYVSGSDWYSNPMGMAFKITAENLQKCE